MKINLKKIVAHNFLSIGDIDLDLANRGYVSVKGKNNNASDNALSNGSGKSSIFNAICWNLTGETLQGLKSNIPNINGDDGCYVTLFFSIDKDDYEITRYRDHAQHKNDLKILVNGQDKSGKGLRESESLLKQYLPDIDVDLIGNIILLGQGLPHKFSNNTPAGRKELLEKLSKSDFMITDIKNRLARRSAELDTSLREKEDDRLKNDTRLKVLQEQLMDNQKKLDNLFLSPTIDADIENLEREISLIKLDIERLKENKEAYMLPLKEKQQQLYEVDDKYRGHIESRTEFFDVEISKLNDEYVTKSSEARSIQSEIFKLDSVKDVCPTCGHKLEGVTKVDTTNLKSQLAIMNEEISKVTKELSKYKDDKQKAISEIQDMIYKEKSGLNLQINEINSKIKEVSENIDKCSFNERKSSEELIRLKNIRENFESTKKELETAVQSLNASISQLNENIMYNNNDITDINDHISVLSKINSLIKRDFRGLLLGNVIDFINKKSKEYCKIVFGTDRLDVYLDGNNLNIDFCNKSLENLSGGEQQRIDIIIQLAIRQMMCEYLNFSSNILVLDEVLDYLDAKSAEATIDLLIHVAQDIESTFFISHHSDELTIPCDETIVIEKDNNGVSRIANGRI